MSEREWLDIFANNLQEILCEYGYNQKQFAEAIGVSEATVSAYLNKRKMPGVKALTNISYELGLTFDELMDFGDRIY